MKIKIKNIFKSKFKIATIMIIMAVVIFGLIVPSTSHAIFGIELAVARGIFTLLTQIIQTVLNWLLLAAAAFFDGMLDIGFTKNISAITEGWKMARDISNMFFILLMVVIAFGTILRSEKYGVKKMLPKIIWVALLINFSMVFCSAIVDVSNIAGEAFVKEIRKGTSGEKGAISATFADEFEVGSNQFTFTNCEDYKNNAIQMCNSGELGDVNNCLKNAERHYNDCVEDGEITVPGPEETLLNILLSGTVGSIVMLIAVFTLFAGGVMLLIRVVAIWLLISISPLAFMCYIVPGLDANWKKWWSKFINYCIFAPVYAFFIWMAIKFAQNSAAQKIAQSTNLPTGSWNTSSTMLVIDPGQQLIKYLLMAAFLVGGLIVAKQLGVAGADSVMKIATNAKKGATDWAKRREQFNRGGLLRGAGSIPGLNKTWLGRKLKYAGINLQTKSLSEKQKKRYSSYSPEDLSAEINSEWFPKLPSPNRLLLAQLASDKKYKDKINAKAAQRVRDTLKLSGFSGFGVKNKAAEDFENERPDSIRDKVKRNNKILEMAREDKLNAISLKALEDFETAQMVEAVVGGTTNYLAFLNDKKRQKAANELLQKAIKEEIEAQKTENDNKRPPQAPPKAPSTPPKTP